MPCCIFTENVVDARGGLVDKIVGDESERLGEFHAGELLDEPVIKKPLPVRIKPGIVDEELLFERLREVGFLSGADLVCESVRQYNLVAVSERSEKHSLEPPTLGPVPVRIWKGELLNSLRPLAMVSPPAVYQDHFEFKRLSVSAAIGNPSNGCSAAIAEYTV